jgi:hypothetical protein
MAMQKKVCNQMLQAHFCGLSDMGVSPGNGSMQLDPGRFVVVDINGGAKRQDPPPQRTFGKFQLTSGSY